MSAKSETALSLCGYRILLVEDEYFIAREIADALRDEGAEVVGPVATVQAALDAVASQRLDAAVLDVNLWGEMAYRVADALWDHKVPFVFTTGYTQPTIALPYAHVPLREKPFDYDAFAKALPRIVGLGGI
jgi:CheY-like chemotaxis protein